MEDMGEAPVPPSYPDIKILSDLAFATPAAIVPTPALETSFTLISASLFAFFRSKISCERSSIEYISWWGGGEINPTPGVEFRTLAIQSSTLWPGNWPPSPGFAPCAILIWISLALFR